MRKPDAVPLSRWREFLSSQLFVLFLITGCGYPIVSVSEAIPASS